MMVRSPQSSRKPHLRHVEPKLRPPKYPSPHLAAERRPPWHAYNCAGRRRAAIRLLAHLELRNAERLVDERWTAPRSLKLDRAIQLMDAVAELGR